MRIYPFPYNEIKKGSKIVIYGGGNVGKQYIAQCKAQGYGEIVMVLDTSALLLIGTLHEAPTREPHEIKSLSDQDYDYVVLAVMDEKEAEVMKQTLLDFGVPKQKIIYHLTWYDSIKDLFSPEVRCWFRPTFSWFGEDLVVYGIFRSLGIKNPSYLDVGCNHPYDGSNTALFYLTGSKGTNIDANPSCIDLMRAERPDDQNLCMGVTPESGSRTFYMVGETHGLNSFSLDYIKTYYKRQNLSERDIEPKDEVKCFTLEEVVSNYCGGSFPDFFDLDIEGLDAAVIKSYDFSKNGPAVICVESRETDMNKHLFGCGYSKYFETPHNQIFVKKDYLEVLLKNNF